MSSSNKESCKFKRFLMWLSNRQLFGRILRHFRDYPYVWILLALLVLTAWIIAPGNWELAKGLTRIALVLLLALLLIRPMNAVYGLMGSSGSIRLFFLNFLFITVLFAVIYHCAFFKDAGISYDVNQPHIDYQLFAGKVDNVSFKVSEKRDTLYFERQIDTISFKESIINVTRDTLHYQRIDFGQVWRSSILTTLTQEPADLLTIATVHNSGVDSSNVVIDRQKSSYFEWILIFHIIISWIFFGVFISLLYNKFRYES